MVLKSGCHQKEPFVTLNMKTILITLHASAMSDESEEVSQQSGSDSSASSENEVVPPPPPPAVKLKAEDLTPAELAQEKAKQGLQPDIQGMQMMDERDVSQSEHDKLVDLLKIRKETNAKQRDEGASASGEFG
jgi:hypothetical protein